VCHQTVSLIARHLEAHGIPTIIIASAFDIVRSAAAPRATFLDYPLGHTCGKPFDADDHIDIVRRSVQQLTKSAKPAEIFDLQKTWDDDSWRGSAMDPGAGDTREVRDATPQYQFDADRALAEANLA
jgi:hypothetical protein